MLIVLISGRTVLTDLAFLVVVQQSQIRSCSSAPIVATFWPHGEPLIHKMRSSWPWRSLTRPNFGYFHSLSALFGKPPAVIISRYSVFHIIPATWFSVSNSSNFWPLEQFQSFTLLSAVPPPEARRLFFHGHQASAWNWITCEKNQITLTLAWWSVKVWSGWVQSVETSLVQMLTVLSLPPEARYWPFGFHFKPVTSCSCLIN